MSARSRRGRQNGQLQQLSGPLWAEMRLLLTSPQSPGQSWVRRPGRARGTCNPTRAAAPLREKASQAVRWIRGLRPYGAKHGAANPVSVRNTLGPCCHLRVGASGPADRREAGNAPVSASSGCCGKPGASGWRDRHTFWGSGGCGSEVPALGDGAPGRSGPSCPPLRERSSLSSAFPKGTDPV